MLALLTENAILRHLNGADARRVVEAGELVEMQARHVIYRAEKLILEVFFPIDCVLSVVTRMHPGTESEVGMIGIGREGTSGVPLLIGRKMSANDCYCLMPGRAIKMSVELFHHLRTTNKQFNASLDRYLQAYVSFLEQLVACNRLHSVYERCARWLLLAHDRVGRNELLLTHENLAMMLGSRRSGVTIALGTLQRAGYIQYAHGQLTIVGRSGLEGTACECYAVVQNQFSGLLQAAVGSNSKA
jgi:CRP-like cAMP-binding protein